MTIGSLDHDLVLLPRHTVVFEELKRDFKDD